MRERAKRLRGCRCGGCPPLYTTACHWGHCTEWRCKACRGLSFSAGAPGCRCSGYVRWLWHPGMHNWRVTVHDDYSVTYGHAAVKPSIARRRQGSRHHRGRAR